MIVSTTTMDMSVPPSPTYLSWWAFFCSDLDVVVALDRHRLFRSGRFTFSLPFLHSTTCPAVPTTSCIPVPHYGPILCRCPAVPFLHPHPLTDPSPADMLFDLYTSANSTHTRVLCFETILEALETSLTTYTTTF